MSKVVHVEFVAKWRKTWKYRTKQNKYYVDLKINNGVHKKIIEVTSWGKYFEIKRMQWEKKVLINKAEALE